MLWTHNNELDRVSDLRGRQRQPGGTRQTKVMSLKLEWSYCWVHPAWDTMPPSLPRDGFSCLWAHADQLSTPLDTHATTVKCSWALSETLQRTMHQVDCFLEEKVMVHPWLQGFKVELCTRVLVHCSSWSPPLPSLPIPHWLSFPHTHTHRPWSGQASSSALDLGWRIGKTDKCCRAVWCGTDHKVGMSHTSMLALNLPPQHHYISGGHSERTAGSLDSSWLLQWAIRLHYTSKQDGPKTGLWPQDQLKPCSSSSYG